MTTKPRTSAKPFVTTFRLEPALIRKLDAERERMEAAQPGVRLSRADAIRVLLEEALAHRQPKTDAQ